ncbi:MAG: hypothetical protein R3Y35_14305, partial [Clostridia bacterium]
MDILEELYHGNINPNTKIYTQNSNYAKAMKLLSDNEELLLKLLDEKEKKLFIEYVNAQSVVTSESNVEDFIIGFKLGAKIALAMVSDEERIF